jgi:hypothetical protein
MIDPLPRLEAVKEDIQNALALVKSVLCFVDTNQASPEIRVAILNNLIVSLVSIIEEGVRSLFVEYLAIIEENVGNYHMIRKNTTDSNIKCAAELLAQSVKPQKKIDGLFIAKELIKCLENASGFKLFKNEITHNRNNMRTEQVGNIAKSVGLEKFWESVRSRQEARDFFPDKNDVQVEQSMLQKWNELFDERDIIVHQISQANGWGQTKISPYISFLDTMATCITYCLADDAKAFLEKKPIQPAVVP